MVRGNKNKMHSIWEYRSQTFEIYGTFQQGKTAALHILIPGKTEKSYFPIFWKLIITKSNKENKVQEIDRNNQITVHSQTEPVPVNLN